MANASKIRIGDIDYDIKDATARDSALTGINVNGTAAEVVDHIAQITMSAGGWEIGTIDEGQTITIRGSGVFGFFIFDDGVLGAVSFDSTESMITQFLGEAEIREQGNGEFVMNVGHKTFYIIFGATSITVED